MVALKSLDWQHASPLSPLGQRGQFHQPLKPLGQSPEQIGQTFQVLQCSLEISDRLSRGVTVQDDDRSYFWEWSGEFSQESKSQSILPPATQAPTIQASSTSDDANIDGNHAELQTSPADLPPLVTRKPLGIPNPLGDLPLLIQRNEVQPFFEPQTSQSLSEHQNVEAETAGGVEAGEELIYPSTTPASVQETFQPVVESSSSEVESVPNSVAEEAGVEENERSPQARPDFQAQFEENSPLKTNILEDKVSPDPAPSISNRASSSGIGEQIERLEDTASLDPEILASEQSVSSDVVEHAEPLEDRTSHGLEAEVSDRAGLPDDVASAESLENETQPDLVESDNVGLDQLHIPLRNATDLPTSQVVPDALQLQRLNRSLSDDISPATDLPLNNSTQADSSSAPPSETTSSQTSVSSAPHLEETVNLQREAQLEQSQERTEEHSELYPIQAGHVTSDNSTSRISIDDNAALEVNQPVEIESLVESPLTSSLESISTGQAPTISPASTSEAITSLAQSNLEVEHSEQEDPKISTTDSAESAQTETPQLEAVPSPEAIAQTFPTESSVSVTQTNQTQSNLVSPPAPVESDASLKADLVPESPALNMPAIAPNPSSAPETIQPFTSQTEEQPIPFAEGEQILSAQLAEPFTAPTSETTKVSNDAANLVPQASAPEANIESDENWIQTRSESLDLEVTGDTTGDKTVEPNSHTKIDDLHSIESSVQPNVQLDPLAVVKSDAPIESKQRVESSTHAQLETASPLEVAALGSTDSISESPSLNPEIVPDQLPSPETIQTFTSQTSTQGEEQSIRPILDEPFFAASEAEIAQTQPVESTTPAIQLDQTLINDDKPFTLEHSQVNGAIASPEETIHQQVNTEVQLQISDLTPIHQPDVEETESRLESPSEYSPEAVQGNPLKPDLERSETNIPIHSSLPNNAAESVPGNSSNKTETFLTESFPIQQQVETAEETIVPTPDLLESTTSLSSQEDAPFQSLPPLGTLQPLGNTSEIIAPVTKSSVQESVVEPPLMEKASTEEIPDISPKLTNSTAVTPIKPIPPATHLDPDSWSSIDDLLQQYPTQSPQSSQTPQKRSQQDVISSLSDISETSTIQRFTDGEETIFSTDVSDVIQPSVTLAQPFVGGTAAPSSSNPVNYSIENQEEQLEQLAWKIYHRLRQRFAIDFERQGRLTDFSPWSATTALASTEASRTASKLHHQGITNVVEITAPMDVKTSQIAEEVYYLVRSRLELEQERYGIRNHHYLK